MRHARNRFLILFSRRPFVLLVNNLRVKEEKIKSSWWKVEQHSEEDSADLMFEGLSSEKGLSRNVCQCFLTCSFNRNINWGFYNLHPCVFPLWIGLFIISSCLLLPLTTKMLSVFKIHKIQYKTKFSPVRDVQKERSWLHLLKRLSVSVI